MLLSILAEVSFFLKVLRQTFSMFAGFCFILESFRRRIVYCPAAIFCHFYRDSNMVVPVYVVSTLTKTI